MQLHYFLTKNKIKRNAYFLRQHAVCTLQPLNQLIHFHET
jgi:hypothetical protein